MRRALHIHTHLFPANYFDRMHIIRFVMPSKNKQLKKLLYLYYEICPKYDQSGKLRQESTFEFLVVRFDESIEC